MIDRLGVRSSCNAVVDSSIHVQIDEYAVARLASDLCSVDAAPEWDTDLHYRDTGPQGDERTAMWIMVLDALNFCFWAQGDDPQHRWRRRWRGELVDGYIALVASLTDAVGHGYPLHDATWLAHVSEKDVATILQPEQGHTEIPLMDHRVRNLRELGRGLLQYGDSPATQLIADAGGSAISLTLRIATEFPSFNDVTTWPYAETGLPNHEVRFYKRAQILVGDISGGLEGTPLAEFGDLHELTAFADYKVPQMLRWLGVLTYRDDLAAMVDQRLRIPAGSRMEVEIRAATIVACDRIVQAFRARGRRTTAVELDWLLWSRSQGLSSAESPYHLTETTFY